MTVFLLLFDFIHTRVCSKRRWRLHASVFNVGKSASGTSLQRCTAPALIWALSLSQSDFLHFPELYGFKELCVIVGRRTKKITEMAPRRRVQEHLMYFPGQDSISLQWGEAETTKNVWVSAFLSQRSYTYGVCLLQRKIRVHLIGKHHFKKPKPLVIVIPARIDVSCRWQCSQILISNKCTTLHKSPKAKLSLSQSSTLQLCARYWHHVQEYLYRV